MAAISLAPTAENQQQYSGYSQAYITAIRGQNTTYENGTLPPNVTADGFAPPQTVYPSNDQFAIPSQVAGPGTTYDPFMSGQGAIADPYGLGASGAYGMYSFDGNGPQPYRYGWTARYDFGILPSEGTSGGNGDLTVFEHDLDLEYSAPVGPFGEVFSFTQEFDTRNYEGPNTPVGSTTELPGSVFRIGWDLELAFNNMGPWSTQIAYNPSINSDFESGLSSDAWNHDARAILFHQWDPTWIWALGVGYWDRVDDYIIPYAGIIWTPDPRWEWRLVFPKPRISYHMGQFLGYDTWFYVRGEYHIESYEMEISSTGSQEQVELKDWRILIGFRKRNAIYTQFFEAGWVLDREVDYAGATPDFDVSDGFIARTGIRF